MDPFWILRIATRIQAIGVFYGRTLFRLPFKISVLHFFNCLLADIYASNNMCMARLPTWQSGKLPAAPELKKPKAPGLSCVN